MSIESLMPSNHLILCFALLLLSSIFPRIKVFSNESVLHIRWPKYWSFSFSISPSNEYSGLISFRIDRFDLLAVQGTLKSLLQHHSSKASILWCSAFFMAQLSHPYMNTGRDLALTRRTFVVKVMSLLVSMLSRLVIASHRKGYPILTADFLFQISTFLSPKKAFNQTPGQCDLEVRALTLASGVSTNPANTLWIFLASYSNLEVSVFLPALWLLWELNNKNLPQCLECNMSEHNNCGCHYTFLYW